MAIIRRRKLKRGNVYQANSRDNGGKRRHKQFKLRKDADAFLTTVKGELADGTHVPESSTMTVEDASQLLIDRATGDNLEPTTIKGYQEHINLHIIPLLGKVKLTKLTQPMIEEFRDKLVLRISDKTDRRIALKTTRSVLATLKSIINEAQGLGKGGKNVARQTNLKMSKRDKKRARVPLWGHICAIFAKAVAEGCPLILLFLLTGLRSSEV